MGSTAVVLLRDGGLVSMAELLVTCCAKAFGGVAGQIGDTNGVIGCDIGVGEQEALSFLEGMSVVEADQDRAVGGISGSSCEVLAEGGSNLLSIDKEFEISRSKGGATDFLVEFELESFAISEELNALHARYELRAVVVGSASS